MSHELTILGGGPAGLAAGHFARVRGIPFSILEAASRAGGNAVTLRRGEFLFDSGAHRFHDRDPEATALVRELLGDELQSVEAPSQIHLEGRRVDFPLSPLNLARVLGPSRTIRAAAGLLRARLRRSAAAPQNFAELATRRYGDALAGLFLLGYTEKLWGRPCAELSTAVAGARLSGLTLRSLLHELLFGRLARTRHLDGKFLYPRQGFGAIADRLIESCGSEHIRLGSRVTALHHDGTRVTALEVNHQEQMAVGDVICTLPLPVLLSGLRPSPPAELLARARGLTFRNVVCVFLALSKESISGNATHYFPGRDVPFTRVVEPRNRSAAMAPPGCTSLVAEIPCDPGDATWCSEDAPLVAEVTAAMVRLGWIQPSDVLDQHVHRIPNAYPVLRPGDDALLAEIAAYLAPLCNLHLTGRNGTFQYGHVHDMIAQSGELVARLVR